MCVCNPNVRTPFCGKPGCERPPQLGMTAADAMGAQVLPIVEALQLQFLKMQAMKADPDSLLDKRALSIAMTELETSMLWLANARP